MNQRVQRHRLSQYWQPRKSLRCESSNKPKPYKSTRRRLRRPRFTPHTQPPKKSRNLNRYDDLNRPELFTPRNSICPHFLSFCLNSIKTYTSHKFLPPYDLSNKEMATRPPKSEAWMSRRKGRRTRWLSVSV